MYEEPPKEEEENTFFDEPPQEQKKNTYFDELPKQTAQEAASFFDQPIKQPDL